MLSILIIKKKTDHKFKDESDYRKIMNLYSRWGGVLSVLYSRLVLVFRGFRVRVYVSEREGGGGGCSLGQT
jgi:hypothetical protein